MKEILLVLFLMTVLVAAFSFTGFLFGLAWKAFTVGAGW
jgi:hypothetical protein